MLEEEKSSGGSSISVKGLLRALKKHVHLLVACSLILLTIGTVVVTMLPNVYKATITILVDPQKIPERYVASTITTDPNARMNTLTQQVLSATRLQEIIEKNDLYPEMRKKASKEEVIEYMRSKTKIEMKADSDQGYGSFSITFEDTHRDKVAAVTNQLATNFISRNLKVREQQAQNTTEFLSGELDEAKISLQEQEAQLQAYRMQHAGATPDAMNGNLQALSRLQTQSEANLDTISRLDQERILLTQVRPESRDTTPLTERDRLLQDKRRLETERFNLKRQFTDTYPDVVTVTQELADVNARLATMPELAPNATNSADPNTRVKVSLLEKEIVRHKEQQTNLERQIQSFQHKVEAVPVTETKLAELSRNYEVSRQNYQSLLDKTFSAGMSEELERKQQSERFTILDPAKTPEKPIKPKRLPLYGAVFAVSLLLPAAVIVAMALLHGVIADETQLKQLLPAKIPMLGTIPPIESKADIRRERFLAVQTGILLVVTCTALAIFLLRIRPTL